MYRAKVSAIQDMVMIPVISTGTAVTAVPISEENAWVTRATPTSPAYAWAVVRFDSASALKTRYIGEQAADRARVMGAVDSPFSAAVEVISIQAGELVKA